MWGKIVLLAFAYISYSTIIDIWADKKIKRMQLYENELPFTCKNLTSYYYLSTINNRSHLVEDIHDRVNWNQLFQNRSDHKLKDGIYHYLHRSYATFEEKYILCSKYWSLHTFIFRIASVSTINIKENKVIISDKFIFFGVYPVTIQWGGQLVSNKQIIKWSQSRIQHYLGKTTKHFKKIWVLRHKLDNIYIFETEPDKYIAIKCLDL